jgi:predicted transcriptional regulator
LNADESENRPVVQRSIQELRTQPLFGQVTTVPDTRKGLARRSQLEVRMDMLAAVKVGADKPTQIMYRANLSWIALQTHLKQLLERGLLRWVADGSRKRYELTTKGANVMYSYIKILEETGEDTSEYLTVGM